MTHMNEREREEKKTEQVEKEECPATLPNRHASTEITHFYAAYTYKYCGYFASLKAYKIALCYAIMASLVVQSSAGSFSEPNSKTVSSNSF